MKAPNFSSNDPYIVSFLKAQKKYNKDRLKFERRIARLSDEERECYAIKHGYKNAEDLITQEFPMIPE